MTAPGTRPGDNTATRRTMARVQDSKAAAVATTWPCSTLVETSRGSTARSKSPAARPRRDIGVRTGSTAEPAGRLALLAPGTDIPDWPRPLWSRSLARPRFPVCLFACPSSSLLHKVLKIIENYSISNDLDNSRSFLYLIMSNVYRYRFEPLVYVYYPSVLSEIDRVFSSNTSFTKFIINYVFFFRETRVSL